MPSIIITPFSGSVITFVFVAFPAAKSKRGVSVGFPLIMEIKSEFRRSSFNDCGHSKSGLPSDPRGTSSGDLSKILRKK